MASNYTTNYQLPKWEKTDRVQMKDFNDMTATLDEALHGLAVSAAAAQAAADSEAAARAAAITALENKSRLVILGTYILSADQLSLTIPILAASNYAELRLCCSITADGQSYTRYSFKLNGSSDYLYTDVDVNSRRDYTATELPLLTDGINSLGGAIRLFPIGSGQIGIWPNTLSYSAGSKEITTCKNRYCCTTLGFSALQSVQITANHAGGASTFTLYGLKK